LLFVDPTEQTVWETVCVESKTLWGMLRVVTKQHTHKVYWNCKFRISR
jgi:hypothetical protein